MLICAQTHVLILPSTCASADKLLISEWIKQKKRKKQKFCLRLHRFISPIYTRPQRDIQIENKNKSQDTLCTVHSEWSKQRRSVVEEVARERENGKNLLLIHFYNNKWLSMKSFECSTYVNCVVVVSVLLLLLSSTSNMKWSMLLINAVQSFCHAPVKWQSSHMIIITSSVFIRRDRRDLHLHTRIYAYLAVST